MSRVAPVFTVMVFPAAKAVLNPPPRAKSVPVFTVMSQVLLLAFMVRPPAPFFTTVPPVPVTCRESVWASERSNARVASERVIVPRPPSAA